MNISQIASLRPAEEFFANYAPSELGRLDDGVSLLFQALRNTNPASRYEVANFLLDQGCPLGGRGNGGATVLHVLFGQVKHDIASDTALGRRLIERGADINALDDRRRLPFLEVLAMKFSDDDLKPIYDLWFEQAVPDFTTASVDGLSPLGAAKKIPYRATILARMEEYVASHP